MSTPSPALVHVERHGRVAHVILNRPEKRNALSATLLDQLMDTLRDLDRDRDVSVVVLRGRGPSFCSGYDLNDDGDPDRAYRREHRDVLADWQAMRAHSRRAVEVWSMATPTIAQVHGYCLAGGAELALMCDLVFTAEDAVIGHPVVRDLGVPPTNVYAHLVGMRMAKEMMLAGRTLNGVEAAAAGLVNRAVSPEELPAFVASYAADLASVPLSLLSLNKQAVNDVYSSMGFEHALLQGGNYDTIAHLTSDVQGAIARLREARSVGAGRAATVQKGAAVGQQPESRGRAEDG